LKNLSLTYIFISFLLTTVLGASVTADSTDHQFSEVASATSIFGKVEVLKTESNNWEFLKRNAQLSPDDIIRMPPISLLRIKGKSGLALPAFHGSRELRVSQFIAEGKDRMAESKSKLDTNLDGEMSIDILPVGNPANVTSTSRIPTKIPQILKVPPLELQNLRYSLQNPSDIVRTYAHSKIEIAFGNQQNDSDFTREFTVYPGKNILQAQYLFETLRKEIQKSALESETQNSALDQLLASINTNIPLSAGNRTALEFMILYGQMLRSTGIEADFITNAKNELFLLFESGRNKDEIGQITANRSLVYPAEKNLWIPISVSDVNNNFTHAWYNGSQLMKSE